MGIPSRYFSIVIIEDIFLHRFLLDSRERRLLSDSVGFYCFGKGKNSYLKLTLLYVGALAPCCQVVDGWVASGGGLRDKRGYFLRLRIIVAGCCKFMNEEILGNLFL